MTRSMVKYQYMADEKARNATLKKRKPSLIKKMNELTCLCDIDACLIMYDEDGASEVWPSPAEAERVIRRFQEATAAAPASAVAAAALDQTTFLEKSISRMKKQLKKEKEKNLRNKMLSMLFDKNAPPVKDLEELKELHDLIDREVEAIDRLIKESKGKEISLDLSL